MQRRQFVQGVLTMTIVGPAPFPHSRGDDVTNLMPLFWRDWEASRGVAMPDRVATLARAFFLPAADRYAAAGFNGAGTHGRLLDARVAAWLTRLDAIAPAVRAVSDVLPDAWAAHERRFAAAGLALPAGAGATWLPSLFAFTGYSRLWRRSPALFVAPDGIVDQLGPRTDLAVLIDHEAFHVVHDAAAPGLTGPTLWMRLWREGLATLASARLNPRATAEEVLMSAELGRAPPDVTRAAARLALAALDENGASAAEEALFAANRHGPLPARAGYLVGWKAADVVVGPRPLVEAAGLPPAVVRPALAAVLERLAH